MSGSFPSFFCGNRCCGLLIIYTGLVVTVSRMLNIVTLLCSMRGYLLSVSSCMFFFGSPEDGRGETREIVIARLVELFGTETIAMDKAR